MLELTVRLIASLAVVVGLMLLLARLVGKRYAARTGAPVQVLHRQPLSRNASVAVITVGSRVLVVGSTDHQVSLLTELDPEELEDVELALSGAADADHADELTIELPAVQPAAQPVVHPAVQPAVETDPAADVVPARGLASLAALASRSSLASLRERAEQRGTHRSPAPRRTSTDDSALAGSVLSPQTWRQAIAAATGKAS